MRDQILTTDAAEHDRKTEEMLNIGRDQAAGLLSEEQFQSRLFNWSMYNEGSISLKEFNDSYIEEPVVVDVHEDLIDNIMRFEAGEMNDEEIISWFQALLDSGLCWTLQGSYGRTAKALIDQGLIS